MPPQLGGIISLLLIFPAIALGARLAEAHPLEKTRKRRVIAGIVLGFLGLLAAMDLLLALLPLLVFFFYGILSSIQIVRRGQGPKRFVVGIIVTVWTIFCLMDYLTSIRLDGSHIAMNEALAVGTLRKLSKAEQVFLGQAHTDSSENIRFGSIEELRNQKLIGDNLAAGKPYSGYLFYEVAAADPKHYLFYAVPAKSSSADTKPTWATYVPGASFWFKFLWHDEAKGTGTRSFAVDETGAVHYCLPATAAPVSQAQAEQWPLL